VSANVLHWFAIGGSFLQFVCAGFLVWSGLRIRRSTRYVECSTDAHHAELQRLVNESNAQLLQFAIESDAATQMRLARIELRVFGTAQAIEPPQPPPRVM
jgi:hypothetical protein